MIGDGEMITFLTVLSIAFAFLAGVVGGIVRLGDRNDTESFQPILALGLILWVFTLFMINFH